MLFLDVFPKDDCTIFAVLKSNKIELDPHVKSKIYSHIKDKITPQNVATYYQLAYIFNMSNLFKVSTNYIQRWFTTVAETNNFLELDFRLVEKVLLDSDLDITTEIEVFNAADDWIGYNLKERSKYSKDVLLTVRLPLMSDHVLKHVFLKPSSFHQNEKSITVINEVLNKKENYFQYMPHSYSTTRYCGQEDFNILFCGDYFCSVDEDGEFSSDFVDLVDGKNLKRSRRFPSLTKNRRFTNYRSSIIYLKGHVYLFNCSDTGNLVEKYSVSADSLEVVADMLSEDHNWFCACGFSDKVYFIGGSDSHHNTIATCTQFDTKDYTWKDVASMNEARYRPACTVFEGRVIVSGGLNDRHLNTVESYDHIADEWSYMPSMIEAGSGHNLVAIKNKLFAMGGFKRKMEVYDSTCNKFVNVKQRTVGHGFIHTTQAISMGNKVLIFFSESTEVSCYDADRDEWTQEPCVEATNNDNFYIKVPKLKV